MGPHTITALALLSPFALALLAPALTRMMGHRAGWVLAILPLLLFVHWLGFLPAVSDGRAMTGGFPWVPSFNVNFSWLIDGLSLTFALLITGIGALIVIYSGGYLKGHPMLGRFFAFILMFMGAMQGLVVSDSFFCLFVFWELTSITSFLLIGFDHAREASRRAALQALFVTGGGGLCLMAALIIAWNVTGVSELSLLLNLEDQLRDSPFYLAIFILLLGGAFTKSAQFPLHFWLPNAMEAPTPVSAYLHSATMVKAGVYLLMRFNPVMGETVLWETVLPLFGGTTLLVGTFLGLRQTDLKLMLAYTTVASLGLLVMLTGVGSEVAIEAAVLYLIAHSLFKGALFMVAGGIDHGTGTRDVTRLGGLMGVMPITFAAAILAALSMGGLPPFLGFLAKEEIYAATIEGEARAVILTAVAVIGNALMFALAFVVALKPFIGERRETPVSPHESPVSLWLGPVVLAVLGIAAAVFSGQTHALFSSPMASAVHGETVTVKIGLTPHLGWPLYLSILTVALGIAAYLLIGSLRALTRGILDAIGWGPDRGFDQVISGLVTGSFAFTQGYQRGRLEYYMTVTFIVTAAILLIPPFIFGEWPDIPEAPSLLFYEWAVIAIAVIGLLTVVNAKNRLTAIVSLGIQGFAVALIFMLFGAPDLSFTQFMVETLSVVILALVMTRLRLSPSDHRPPVQRVIDFCVAIACGIGFALLLLNVTQMPFDRELSDFFTQYSRSIAHGRNIVNVILVDFRALDTLGEIAVVGVAGLAILSLIRVRMRMDAPTEPAAAEKPGDSR